MKLETNLPVVFLTLLVIAIVILGYLELKKLNERIKMLEYLNKEKKVKSPPEKVDNVVADKVVDDVEQKIVNNGDQKHHEVISSETNNRVQEWQMNNEKDNIINTLNKKEEYIEEIEGDQHVFFNGGMFPQPPMMYKVMGVDERDEIIDKINNDETINFENIQEEETLINEIGGEGNKEIIIEGGDISDNGDIEEQCVEVKDESSDISGDGSGEESVEESVEEINLKELSEEEDFSKNKINVDESFSVNQLKAICKNLGLQLSGNKTTLIKRIMDNQ